MLQHAIAKHVVEPLLPKGQREQIGLAEVPVTKTTAIEPSRIDGAAVVKRVEPRSTLQHDFGKPSGAAAGFQYPPALDLIRVPAGPFEEPIPAQSRAVDAIELHAPIAI